MSVEALEFVVVVLGALLIIGGVIAIYEILERHREHRYDEAQRLRMRRELNRRTTNDVLDRYREVRQRARPSDRR